MKTTTAPLILVALLAGACLVHGGEFPSFILFNGDVTTMVIENEVYEAIALDGNLILSVGTSDDLLATAGPETQLIDLNGASVYPGFIDPHTHLLNDSWNAGLSPIESQTLAIQYGITAAANMYTTEESLAEYTHMAQQGDIRVRFSLYLIYNTSCGDVVGHWYDGYRPFTELATRLHIGGIKIFSETSVCNDDLIGISFTAGLQSVLTPAGAEWYGKNRPLFSQLELTNIIRTVSELGFPVAIHAIGDGGIQLSLDAIEHALDSQANGLRHALLHNLFIRDDNLYRYADLGVVAAVESMSSCFASFYQDLLPESSRHIVRRWGDLVTTGAHVAANSDWPWSAEEAINPLFRLQALMSPTNHSTSYAAWEPCGLLPETQLLTAWQGLRMMTVEAAFMLHRDDELGTLEPGKLADLVVLTANPLHVKVEALTDIHVQLTMIDGAIEYDDHSLARRAAPSD